MTETQNAEAKFQDELLVDDLRGAEAALSRALSAPPQQLTRQADLAERQVVRARDNLIHRLRQDGSSPQSPRWHELLDQLNVALSLIIAVEYPLAAVQRQSAEQARDLLKRLIDQGLD